MLNPRLSASRLSYKSILLCFSLSFAIITGCVTVNVNFPESAVQKASDDFVGDLYRTKEQGKSTNLKGSPTPTPPSEKTSAISISNFFMSTALADGVVFDLNSPSIVALKSKLKANVPDIIEQKKAGVLGETNDGNIVIHDAAKLKPLQKKKVEDLVKDENQTRGSLYKEIISSKHLPSDRLDSVKKSFAHSFQAESPSGTWIQAEGGGWSQKP